MEAYDAITLPNLFTPGYGLVDVVNWLTPANSHWQNGVQYYASCYDVAVTMSPCVSGATVANKAATWSRVNRGARAFTVYGEADCSPAGSDWWEVGQSEALQALSAAGPTQVEATFWSGESGASPALVYPNLTSVGPVLDGTQRITLQPSSTLISGVPLDIVEAMGRLEETFGQCYPGLGMIHVPVRLAPAMCARNLVYRERNRWYTEMGHTVIFGDGYASNIGPGGTAPPGGSSWIWVTSPVFGYRGKAEAFPPIQSLDRSIDTVKFIAEQTYLLGWECCRIGVLVTTGGEQAGEPTTPLQDT